jgi:hypothetical protein
MCVSFCVIRFAQTIALCSTLLPSSASQVTSGIFMLVLGCYILKQAVKSGVFRKGGNRDRKKPEKGHMMNSERHEACFAWGRKSSIKVWGR